MSESDTPAESLPAPPAPESDASRSAARRPPRRGATATLALLLALLALAAAGYGGWRLWRLDRGGRQDAQAVQALRERVDAVSDDVARLQRERGSLSDRLKDADAVNRGLRQQVLGLGERTRNLEDAVANLSAKSLSGHDAMLLDQAESLLRMARERYTLFHDADTAMQAYALADRTLAGVEDAAFAGVRQSVEAEREALANTHPAQRQADLATLARLRGDVDALPPKPLDRPDAQVDRGFWARAWHAVSTLVTVRREDAAAGTGAGVDVRLARELLALDLAQAQAARLAWDDDGFRTAVQRADQALAQRFDGADDGVARARAALARLVAHADRGPAPQLGDALDELRSLRAVRAERDRVPARAASSGGPGR